MFHVLIIIDHVVKNDDAKNDESEQTEVEVDSEEIK